MLHPLWPVYRAAAQRMPVAAVRPALHRVTRGGPLVGKTLVVETLEAGAQTFQYVLELVGVVAFSISGAMAGIRHKLDWFGVIVLAWVVSVGGGTLRDLILAQPAWWLEQPWQLLLSLVAALTVLLISHPRGQAADTWRVVLVADAAGLAVFAALGADTAITAGASGWAAVALGVLTGTGGGIIRDVLVNRPPLVLTGQIYALAAVCGASLQVLLLTNGVNAAVATWMSVCVTMAVRLLAMKGDWSLPTPAGGRAGE